MYYEYENLKVFELDKVIYRVLIDYFPAKDVDKILARIKEELKDVSDICEVDYMINPIISSGHDE